MSLLLSLLSPVCLASFLTTSASPPRIYYCLTACDRLLLGGCLIPPVPKMVSFKAGPFMFGSCKYLRWDDTACVLSWPLFTRNYLVGRRQRAWTSPHGSHGNVHIKRQAGRNFSLRYLKSYPAVVENKKLFWQLKREWRCDHYSQARLRCHWVRKIILLLDLGYSCHQCPHCAIEMEPS